MGFYSWTRERGQRPARECVCLRVCACVCVCVLGCFLAVDTTILNLCRNLRLFSLFLAAVSLVAASYYFIYVGFMAELVCPLFSFSSVTLSVLLLKILNKKCEHWKSGPKSLF